VPRRRRKTGRISVFKGREAKLNRLIFQILSVEGPLTIYEVCKRIKTKRGLKHTKYTNVNRRVRALKKSGYLQKVGARKTKAGFKAALYRVTPRAYLAILLNELDLDRFIRTASEERLITAIAALTLQN
jgi:hypothetical protein